MDDSSVWLEFAKAYAHANRATQRRMRVEQRHRGTRFAVSDAWIARALRVAVTKMTADESSGCGVELDLLALVAPAALVRRLLVEAALNAQKHGTLMASLRRVADVFDEDAASDLRLGALILAALSAPEHRAFFETPGAAEQLARFVRRLLDAQQWVSELPVVNGAVFECLDHSVDFSSKADAIVAPPPMQWSEFIGTVALPIVTDATQFDSVACDAVFAVLCGDPQPLSDAIVDDADVFCALCQAVGASLPQARTRRCVREVERRVALFGALCKLTAVRACVAELQLPSEAVMRVTGIAPTYPYPADLGAHLTDDQRCLLSALFSGSGDSEALWRYDTFVADAATAVLDSLCAVDLRALDALDAAALPTALVQWLSHHERDDDALLRFSYMLNAWLQGQHFDAESARNLILLLGRFPAEQRGRRDCLTQLTLALAELLRRHATVKLDESLQTALDEVQWTTLLQASKRRRNQVAQV
jgi:hypothetical protein